MFEMDIKMVDNVQNFGDFRKVFASVGPHGKDFARCLMSQK
jgi:hypothetical protein